MKIVLFLFIALTSSIIVFKTCGESTDHLVRKEDGRSKVGNTINSNSLEVTTIKDSMNSIFANTMGSRNNDNHNNDEVFLPNRASSTDSHHQISIEEYRRMFHDMPKPYP
ncbi:hypothetical protein QJS10_CPA09g01777 [Acorus calamus]|uniref:Uncharacterized protein n=1 Tax=Acorus calamus TaxID=4465 RepID=A0AAV9E4Z5_ACOCL|nr:hypothetical protein QJS10_CPA09g01777 [Acorus calamus]